MAIRDPALLATLKLDQWTTEEIEFGIKCAPESAKLYIKSLNDELALRKRRAQAQSSFMSFVGEVWPDFIHGKHHARMAEAFEAVANGTCKRLIINMPPRHTKSEFASYLLPAWFLGKFPGKKVIQTSHTAELAVGFGRKVRNLIDSDAYREIFPTVTLAADNKSAGRWNTNVGGEYYACGVGSALAGRGADLLLVDDPHNEQDIINGNFDVFEKAYEWFTYGARTRLMPGGRVAIIQTRWHQDDLTGRVVRDMVQNDEADQYEKVEFPAIFNENTPQERALWPEQYSLEALRRTKASMPVFQWNAQYQQNPTAEEASVVKREWWQIWENENPPMCEFVIQSWDTAFLKTQRSDYCACTTWGVFYQENNVGVMVPHIILLNSFKERMEFPELKQAAFEHYKEWEPDAFIVEAKASGAPLVFELRRMGIPVSEFTPTRGNDKIARLNSVTDLFASGKVWAPGTRWADEVIEQMASFPNSDHDDLVDSSTQALIRFRKGGFVSLPSDDEDDQQFYRRKAAYY